MTSVQADPSPNGQEDHAEVRESAIHAWWKSTLTGEPLSGDKLGEMFSRSGRWGRVTIGRAKAVGMPDEVARQLSPDSPGRDRAYRVLRTRVRRRAAVAHMRVSRERQDGVIYFILLGGLVKIGFTSRAPEARLAEYPPHAVLLGSVSGTWDDEQAAHAKLQGSVAGRREWYHLTPEVRDYVLSELPGADLPDPVVPESDPPATVPAKRLWREVALGILAGVTAVAGTLAVTAAGFTLSFDAIAEVGKASRISAELAWMLPVSIDGAMAVATVVAVVMKRLTGRNKVYPWVVVLAGAAISVACNAVHATSKIVGGHVVLDLDEYTRMGVSAIPAVMLALSVHLIVTLVSTFDRQGGER